MTKVLIIDKQPSKINFEKEFIELVNSGIEIHVDCLTQDKVKTLRKADITIDYNSIFEYDHIILVGADSLKVFSESKGIGDVTGKLVVSKAIDGKKHESVFAIASFAQLYFKPEMKPVIKESVDNICNIIINGKPEVKEGDYRPITDEQEAIDYIVNYASKSSVLALDSETSAFYPRDGRVLGMSMSHKEYQGVYIASEALTDTVLSLVQGLIDSPNIELVKHNSKFDLKFFEYHYGLSFEKAFAEGRYHDSLLLHYVLDERRGTHGLKPLAIKYTDMGDYDFELDQFKKSYCQTHKIKQEDFSYELIPFETMWPYAAKDTDATLRLFNKFKPLVYANPRLLSLYENIMIPGTRFLNRMEERGVPVSLERLEKAKQALYSQIEHLRTQMFETPEVKKFIEVYGTEPNFNSPIQLRNFLYDICKIPPIQKYTDSGALSTDAEVLQKLGEDYDIAKQLLELRKASKILNTYIIKMIDNVDRDGRLRTGFNLFTTTSGRLSSAGKLNLQQLPRDNPIVKGMITAPPGYKIVAQDMETAEVWVAAALSRDKNLMAVFQELRAGAGNAVSADLHSTIAKMVFNLPCEANEVKSLYPAMRQAAKAITFGILYGSGPAKVAEAVNEALFEQHVKTGEPYNPIDVSDAKGYIEVYFKRFPQLKRWIEQSHQQILEYGYIYGHFGRKRRLRNIKSSDRGLVGEELRSGFNAIIQGASSDILLLGAIDLDNHLVENNLPAEVIMLVHDSVVAIVKEDFVEEYEKLAIDFIQKDRGLMIPNAPMGVDGDSEEGGSIDYSCGKLEKAYPELCV